MSTSTKTKKARGAAITATSAKRTRRAGNSRKAPVNKIQCDLTKEEALSNKLDALMVLVQALTDKISVLAGRVDAVEARERVAESSPVSPRPAPASRRRASPPGSPDSNQEVTEKVHKRVAKQMRQLQL